MTSWPIVFFVLWLVVMAAVPIVAGLGKRRPSRMKRYRSIAISAGVAAQVVVVVVALAEEWPQGAFARAVIVVPLLGWLAEFIGSRTGIPFGSYHYTDALQPQILRVPVVIPLAWLMMLPPSWAAVHLLIPDAPHVVKAVAAGWAFMAWDIYLDPHLVKWGFWKWRERGRYEGIPMKNFFGWFLWATVISIVVLPPELPLFPLAVVYILTWLFQFGGHLAFWRWPVSGWAGFVAMGTIAIPVVIKILGAM